MLLPALLLGGTSAAPEPGTLANSSLAAYYNNCVIRE